MEMSGWDRVYRQRGHVQFEALPKVKIAATKFTRRSYRRVLDLACGTGRHSIYLAKAGFTVHATDISESGLAIARQKAKSAGLKILFVRHDMRAIPFEEGYFDAVVCVWSLDIGTFSDISMTVNEIRRILKKGGTVITDFISVNDQTYGKGRETERNTFVGASSHNDF